jgi:hypothetical protein
MQNAALGIKYLPSSRKLGSLFGERQHPDAPEQSFKTAPITET